ncbi:hypothetical protein GM415_09635 [Pseudodesulfovibrio cashew]|uniref:Uncharacterized protein n=1 Tax=Pseudodesulfovibrio cashew TaxID=2678688 RepID=A0A6I6JH83_9BACT|nr:hypothetical protein [Pseudodesulfovibrio cashew]QGY40378.1 hypothetical protein GM415_09635 [Pseudodesulfovibrio cashew]
MFDSTYVNDSIGMHAPHGPYVAAFDGFFGNAQEESRFRQQRLGVYFLSDLFSAGYMGKTDYVKDKELVTLARDKTMTFTGETFDQWDLDVLIHCVMRTPTSGGGSEKVRIDPGELLRAVNLRNYDMNRERVFSSLWRLHMGSMMIEGKGYRYMTRLIDRVLLDQRLGSCLVEVNQDVVTSIRHERNLSLDMENRRCFKRNGLAKWLHGAIMSFKGGFVAEMECLRALCGAPDRSRHAFPARLTKALDVMSECDAIRDWQIDGDKVKVVPSCTRRDGTACGYISPSLF